MRNFLCLGLLAFALVGTAAGAQSVGGSMPTMDGSSTSNHMSGALSQDQFQKIGDYADQAKRLSKDDKAKGKTVDDLLAEDKAKASELAKSMHLSCEVTDAVLSAEGPADIDGKKLNTHTYETACSNGMGYFLVAVDGGKPYGFSCLAAEATRQVDVAAKRQPGAVCKLGANVIPENMASSVMSHAGVSCMVSKINYIGLNSKSKIEYDEVACLDGKGYILVSALPGQTISPQTMSCHDAAMRGIVCKLTDSGPVVTKQTFIDALAAHKVPCAASADKMHIIGQETAKKRYVVEFLCPAEQPKGLVAFIPLSGSTSPFEAVDCKAAARKSAVCKLTTAQ